MLEEKPGTHTEGETGKALDHELVQGLVKVAVMSRYIREIEDKRHLGTQIRERDLQRALDSLYERDKYVLHRYLDEERGPAISIDPSTGGGTISWGIEDASEAYEMYNSIRAAARRERKHD
jgi:hypothetical protein